MEFSYPPGSQAAATRRYSPDSIAFKFTIEKRTESIVTFRVLCRTNFVDRHSSTSSISFPSNLLRTLHLSCRSFHSSRPLFSTTSGLFLQNTRGGGLLRKLVRCTEAQTCLSVTPLFATLTHSVSRKSFPCHSYANTRLPLLRKHPGWVCHRRFSFRFSVFVLRWQTQRHASQVTAVRASSICCGNRAPITSSPRPICFYTKPQCPPEAGQAC